MKMKIFELKIFAAVLLASATHASSWDPKFQGDFAPIDGGYYLCTLQCGRNATAWCGTEPECEFFETDECIADESFEVGKYLPFNEVKQQCQGYADFVTLDPNPIERHDLMAGYFDSFFNMTQNEGERFWRRRLTELTVEHGPHSEQVKDHHRRRLNIIDDIKKGVEIIAQGKKILDGDPYTVASGIIDKLATQGCAAAVAWLTGGSLSMASNAICNAAKALLRPALDWLAQQGAKAIQAVKDLGTKFVNWVSKGWNKIKDGAKKVWGGIKSGFKRLFGRRLMSSEFEKPLFMLRR